MGQNSPGLGPDALRLRSIRFARSVAAGSTITLSRAVRADATVEQIRVRIYAGAELALRIRPYVQNTLGQTWELIEYAEGGKTYIDGDDDTYVFPVRLPVDGNTETIKVQVTNTDPTNAYDFVVDVILDFSHGKYPGVGFRG